MKSLSFKTKLILNTITIVVLAVFVIDLIGNFLIHKISFNSATELVENIETENVQSLNYILANVEHSVSTLYGGAIYELEQDNSFLENEKKRENYLSQMDNLAYNIAKNTEGACSIYLRFDKYATYHDEGVFYIKKEDDFIKKPVTNVNNYQSSDIDHVGWYYNTIAAGKGSWLMPYYDANMDMNLISYTIPIYVNNVFKGIVGIDVDINILQEAVKNIAAYDSGYGFLLNNTTSTVYHPDYSYGSTYTDYSDDFNNLIVNMDSNPYYVSITEFTYNSEKIWLSTQTLQNEMILGIVIKEKEIFNPMKTFITNSILLSILILIIAIIITIVIIQSLIKPLNEMTDVAHELANGNMQVEINYKSNDEFGKLADSLKKMRDELSKSFEHMNGLVYTDIMTGASNKGAFNKDSKGITESCIKSETDFGVIVLDINNLKTINDLYGHNTGDELIKGVATELLNIFGKRNTYRIGGDEFCILIRNASDESLRDQTRTLKIKLQEFSYRNGGLFHGPVSVAVGYSLFRHGIDDTFESVYNRADELMYKNKKLIKEKNLNKADN
ncbi:MAG: diguanylate cyclase [Butyrivibrio sp.]|nr:diguanylate cyclase [Butyrivibrio sp.]